MYFFINRYHYKKQQNCCPLPIQFFWIYLDFVPLVTLVQDTLQEASRQGTGSRCVWNFCPYSHRLRFYAAATTQARTPAFTRWRPLYNGSSNHYTSGDMDRIHAEFLKNNFIFEFFGQKLVKKKIFKICTFWDLNPRPRGHLNRYTMRAQTL